MANLEDWNYWHDSRTRGPIRKPTLCVMSDNGWEETYELAYKWEVCPGCGGEGSMTNPSIDAGGLTADELYSDPDFTEAYVSGAFDVPCNLCEGNRVVPTVDRDKCSAEELTAYDEQKRDELAYEAECRMERALGC